MKKLLATSCVLGFAAMAPAAFAAESCGNVSIVSMTWQSAEVLANLDQFILNKGYGCNAEVIVGDTVPSLTSMVEKGQPDLAPEGWTGLVPEVIANGTKEGKIQILGDALQDGGQQGWWVPKYLVDAHPDIKTIADALKHPELFPDPENPSQGAVFNGPQGWGGTLISTQLFTAYDGKGHNFNLVDTGSAAGLDGSLARAYERKQGWIGYYWAPTALLGKYEMVMLDFGVPYDGAEWARCTSVADCPDPKPNAWPIDKVATIITTPFAERAPADVKDYLSKRSWSNKTVNGLMAWMSDNQATGEDGAKHFLKENPDLWTPWVSPEAADKIKAAL
ncbi:ABC transporter substrate-binding protein [Paracoccus aminophilus]|uniref:Glycine betaine/proline transport system, substrate-binding protein n=1 Tax=Paracoccus aminophilus JCM 7686 TaxID=1367847 RepID=S5XVA6_PARAH|nr:ABC transporter substrate-binding protein [Paracoccus aminophilus]AGT07295.1 glycine betaine/proline transport system, substrate-binding protein [Paracoccus aminophilus JCM 7686]